MPNRNQKIEQTAKDIFFAPFTITGEVTAGFVQMMINTFDFIGQFILMFVRAMIFILKGGVRLNTLIQQMSFLGADSIFIVVLCIGFTGMTLATILTQQIESLSYGEELIGGAMLWSMGKELAPVLSALIIAGRAGAGIASEIGTMKVTDQIDALRASAVPPIRYLVVPRLLACIIMVPIITLFAAIVGVYAGYIAVHYISPLEVSYMTYFESVKNFYEMDIARSLLKKSLIFGVIIAIVGCVRGFETKGGASGVGRAVTSSVVTSMILIFLADVLITIVKL
ncbi:ABC transporter permease [bacterium]|nr:ABC transporter permease [bacterium]